MVQLNVGLTEAVQSLQLSVAVRRWRREDEEGESEDMSIMKEYLESQSQPMMDQNQVDIMKDIMNALKVSLFCCRRSISDDVLYDPTTRADR